MNTGNLYGKTLPVIFSIGYLRCFEEMMGSSVTMAYYQGPAHDIIPNKEERERWLAPLYEYFQHDSRNRRPLDYMYFSLLELGARNNFLPNEQGVIYVTRQVGKRWWFGLPPVYPVQDETSLKLLLSPDILKHLNTFKSSSITTQLPTKTSKELIQLGLFAFIELFSKKSEILCRASQKGLQIEINIDECPFCLKQSEFCRVFFGIIEGLLEWLHGTHQPNAIESTLQINEAASTSHSILLDIL